MTEKGQGSEAEGTHSSMSPGMAERARLCVMGTGPYCGPQGPCSTLAPACMVGIPTARHSDPTGKGLEEVKCPTGLPQEPLGYSLLASKGRSSHCDL